VTDADRQKAREIVTAWLHGSEEHRKWLLDVATEPLAQALAFERAAGRREMREEAEVVMLAEEPDREEGEDYVDGWDDGRAACLGVLRALPDHPEPKEKEAEE